MTPPILESHHDEIPESVSQLLGDAEVRELHHILVQADLLDLGLLCASLDRRIAAQLPRLAGPDETLLAGLFELARMQRTVDGELPLAEVIATAADLRQLWQEASRLRELHERVLRNAGVRSLVRQPDSVAPHSRRAPSVRPEPVDFTSWRRWLRAAGEVRARHARRALLLGAIVVALASLVFARQIGLFDLPGRPAPAHDPEREQHLREVDDLGRSANEIVYLGPAGDLEVLAERDWPRLFSRKAPPRVTAVIIEESLERNLDPAGPPGPAEHEALARMVRRHAGRVCLATVPWKDLSAYYKVLTPETVAVLLRSPISEHLAIRGGHTTEGGARDYILNDVRSAPLADRVRLFASRCTAERTAKILDLL